jgi:hypothetical protein
MRGVLILAGLAVLALFGLWALQTPRPTEIAVTPVVAEQARVTPRSALGAFVPLSPTPTATALPPLPTSVPPAQSPADAEPWDRAAAIAVARQDGVALELRLQEGAREQFVEVRMSDGSRVLVDLAQGGVVEIDPGPQGRGRGVERQRLERAEIAAAVIGSPALIGFDRAAATARLALGPPQRVALVIEQGQLVYEVRGAGDRRLLLDPETASIIAP